MWDLIFLHLLDHITNVSVACCFLLVSFNCLIFYLMLFDLLCLCVHALIFNIQKKLLFSSVFLIRARVTGIHINYFYRFPYIVKDMFNSHHIVLLTTMFPAFKFNLQLLVKSFVISDSNMIKDRFKLIWELVMHIMKTSKI